MAKPRPAAFSAILSGLATVNWILIAIGSRDSKG
jgi:hypothetical protein